MAFLVAAWFVTKDVWAVKELFRRAFPGATQDPDGKVSQVGGLDHAHRGTAARSKNDEGDQEKLQVIFIRTQPLFGVKMNFDVSGTTIATFRYSRKGS